MKTIILATMLAARAVCALHAKDLPDLKILYVGSERTADYVAFLKHNVAQVESRDRHNFNPADATPFDVVLLDWPQQGMNDFPPKSSPLGQRQEWNKPTVLLGSAGLKSAVVWKLKGGSGCTCLSPLAYGLRDHPVFERPFKIERKMVRIPTPEDFRDEIKQPEIEILPLVDDISRNWPAGWCSYSADFDRNPDVEFFCGGVNHKTPTAGALWRQGNLFHFGFEQSPGEMNETGRKLLLNSIAYISHFTQDRPFAATPSPFAGPVAPSRNGVLNQLKNPEYRLDWIKEEFEPRLWAKISSEGREKATEWVKENGRFLHPNDAHQLEIDADLVAIGVEFDKPEFFNKTIADLRVGGATATRAQRLLECYVPSGPNGGSADQWAAWWTENKAYAFPSDSCDYCWYIDPLAKKRSVPTSKLRGILRADDAIVTASR